MPTRNVVITDHQAKLIDSLVECGRYQNASEVLREGIRLIEEREQEQAAKLEALRAAVQVGIDLPADRALKPGLSVRVKIIVEEHKDSLAVPRESVVTDENGDSVISVVEKDQATHKTVKTGLEENGLMEISADGIKEGTTIVTAGAFGLPAASRVRILD